MIELIWDAERSGTAVAPSGATARIGDEASFTPDDLVAMAASACLMRTFLALAARHDVPVLSYTSTAEMVPSARGGSQVAVRAFVVAPDSVPKRQVLRLLARAKRASPLCGLLGDRLRCEADIRAIHSPSS
jgi:organic hydroperoxide reductase OsmC/OhrA